MRKTVIIATFVLLVQALFGQTKNFIDQPFIETTATVDTLVTPDEIYLTISLTEKDTKGKISVEALETKMVTALQQLGVNTEEDLTLNDLSSNFKKYFLKDQDILKVKTYTLKVNDAVTAGRAILELEKIEISNVILTKTEYSKIEELKLELKSKAMVKAKKQAESLVQPLNQKVGSAIYISDDLNNFAMNQFQGRANEMVIRGYSSADKEVYRPADIEFKKIKVETSIAVKFKLEQ